MGISCDILYNGPADLDSRAINSNHVFCPYKIDGTDDFTCYLLQKKLAITFGFQKCLWIFCRFLSFYFFSSFHKCLWMFYGLLIMTFPHHPFRREPILVTTRFQNDETETHRNNAHSHVTHKQFDPSFSGESQRQLLFQNWKSPEISANHI